MRHDQEAVEVARKLDERHRPETKAGTRPAEELGELRQQISTTFDEIILAIDRLDECDIGSNRARLIEVLSNLHQATSMDLQLYVVARLRR
jgi:hypothetical protein